jgi:hypothetical protein
VVSKSQLAPYLATATALWLTLSPLASTLHGALVAHAVCEEHGELIHVAAVVEGNRAGPSTAPSYESAAAPGAHTDDAHCKVSATLERPLAALDSSGDTQQVGHGSPDISTGSARPFMRAVLDTAPKASPPAG